jgi:hypothetical protein
VEACKLYRFIRPPRNQVDVPRGETTAPTAFNQEDNGNDMKQVLKKIKQQLRDIWKNIKGNQL